jgi:predicted DNA-binding transcriptional regulator AlpA
MKRSSKRRSKAHRHGRPFPNTPPPVPVDAPDLVPGDVRFLSKQEVLAKVNVSAQTLWSWIKQGRFPAARQYGDGRGRRSKIGWLSSEVDAWMLSAPRRIPKGHPSGTVR